MKSTVEQLNPVQYRVSVEVAPEEVTQAFTGIFRDLQRRSQIQGFRPGKAPLNVVRRLYSERVSQDVMEALIRQHLYPALNEKTLRPVASPMVDAPAAPVDGQAFSFSAVVDVMPELKLDGYKGLDVEADTFTVDEQTVDREVRGLRLKQARTTPLPEGAQAAVGMLATISHSATHDGQALPRYTVEDVQVRLGENELFASLEAALMGMKVGETKAVPVTLPADHDDPALANQTLEFTLTLTDLKGLDLPQLDDEFAKDLNFESAAMLAESVMQRLQDRARDMERQRLESAVLDKILTANPFDVPPAMVDQVIDSMILELIPPTTKDADKQRLLKASDLRNQFLPMAKRRTQNTLVLWHVSQQEKLELTDAEVAARVEQTLGQSQFTDSRQAAQVRNNVEGRLRESMVFEKAMDFLIENAKITKVSKPL